VIAAVVPWNFPLLLACWKLGPALAAAEPKNNFLKCSFLNSASKQSTALRMNRAMLFGAMMGARTCAPAMEIIS
ncbi:aldehyde dehydrogenase family protein, partial [Klebsiella pneumoniae]